MPTTKTTNQMKNEWGERASKHLKGKVIAEVRYLTKEEVDGIGWYKSTLAIFFTDGSYIFPSQDDEGNDAGALFTSFDDLDTIPVIQEGW